MVSDNFSEGDHREMTQLHGHSFDEGTLSWVGIPPMSAFTRVLRSRWNLCGVTPSWVTAATFLVLSYRISAGLPCSGVQ